MKVGELYRTTKLDINCHCIITSIDRSTCPFIHYTFFDKRDNRSHNFSCPVSEFLRYYELLQWNQRLDKFGTTRSMVFVHCNWLSKLMEIVPFFLILPAKEFKSMMSRHSKNGLSLCNDCSWRHVQKSQWMDSVDSWSDWRIFRFCLVQFQKWKNFARLQRFECPHWKVVRKSMIPIGSIWKRRNGDELIIIIATVEDTTEYFKFRMNCKDWLPTYNIPDFYKRLQWKLEIFTKIRTIAKYSWSSQ